MAFPENCPISQTATSSVYERARARHVRLSWNLIDEWGPAHNRRFHVKLSVFSSTGELTEVFEGCGSNIKGAKQAAASTALEQSSILNVGIRKRTTANPNKLCFVDLLDGISCPAGPRAEIQQLARSLHIRAKFVQHTAVSKVIREYYGNPKCAVVNCSRMHKVILHLAGRRYVGEATSRAGAEQEASLSALKALKRALDTVLISRKSKVPNLGPEDFMDYIQPNSATWRLKLLAALHFREPSYEVSEIPKSDSSFFHPTYKRTFRVVCFLNSFGSVEAFGPSKSTACNKASCLMLARLLDNDRLSSAPDSKMLNDEETNKVSRKASRSKTAEALRIDRANPNYGHFVHPVARLDHVCFARGLESPTYLIAEADNNEHFVNRKHEFMFVVRVGSESVRGPPSNSKRLARRLAAETMLTHLGFSKPASPMRPSVLHPPPNTDTYSHQDKSGGSVTHSGDDRVAAETFSPSFLQPTRHVEFSYSRDVLSFENVEQKLYPHQFPGQSGRCHRPSKSFGCRSQKQRSKLNSDLVKSKPDFETHDRTANSSSIGYWSDSQEAQSVPRRSTMRRGHSSTILRRFSDVAPSGRTDSHEDHLPVRSVSCSPDQFGYIIPPNVNLMLLCRIASLCLEELKQHGSSSDLTTQLLTFCQRLRIPCQFVDEDQAKPTNKRTPAMDLYHSTLTIGSANRIPMEFSNASVYPNLIVAKGSGPSRGVARQQATLSAFHQLSTLAR